MNGFVAIAGVVLMFWNESLTPNEIFMVGIWVWVMGIFGGD